nr:hypothetical protein [Nocardioides panacis]
MPVLGAYGVQRVVSSTSTRCRQTVGPYADVLDVDVETSRELSEEEVDPDAVEALVHGLIEAGEPAVVCTHRPVLPHVYAALGVPDPKLDAGGDGGGPPPPRPGGRRGAAHRLRNGLSRGDTPSFT